jgi:hypothetical protein
MSHCVSFHSAVTLSSFDLPQDNTSKGGQGDGRQNDIDVCDAQKLAYDYRSLCKRPIRILITKQDDGYYCRSVA